MRILATAALALVAAATPAYAQDAAFQGPRVEVIGGWDRAQSDGEGQSGFVYGGGFGYDIQRGHIVYGVDAEATGSTTKDCEAGACIKAGRDFYAGGRLGYTVTPNTLVYGKVGYTNARVIATAANFHNADNLDGIRLGAGIERNFGRVFAKTEYRYSNYSQDFSRHQIVAGLGYRF